MDSVRQKMQLVRGGPRRLPWLAGYVRGAKVSLLPLVLEAKRVEFSTAVVKDF